MKYKKYILILLVSIAIFLSLTFIYNKITNKNDYVEVFVLNETVVKGEKIPIDKMSKINMLSSEGKFDYIKSIEEIKGKVTNSTLNKGTIILKDDLIDINQYEENKNTEYVSIKVSSSDSSVSYQILPNSLVNIYFTGKTSQINDLVSTYSKAFEYLSSGAQESYTTTQIIEKIPVIDTFNKSGISLNNKESLAGDTLIDTIMIKVDKENALLINNLKKYGEFSFSIVK